MFSSGSGNPEHQTLLPIKTTNTLRPAARIDFSSICLSSHTAFNLRKLRVNTLTLLFFILSCLPKKVAKNAL